MLKRNYCVVFINDIDNGIDRQVKRIVLNLFHYWMIEYSYQVKIKIFTYYESALEFASEYNYEHLIIIDIGNDLEIKGQFLQELDQFLNEKDVLVGHILDKKERYYELHRQCFYINTVIWKKIGRPKIGHVANSKLCVMPNRSTQNHHDDYTPYFIEPSEYKKKYTNLKFGHNLIHEFLKYGYTIRSFDTNVRNSKFYIYPRDKNNKVSRYLDIIDNKKIYFYNTEKINFEILKNLNLSRFATVASGLNHLIILKNSKITDDFKLCFFDYNDVSLSFFKDLYKNWDGKDYKDFVYSTKSLEHIKFSFDDNLWNNFICNFKTKENFVSFFNDISKLINIEYVKIDIMTDNLDFFQNFFQGSADKLFWLSNIFHYKPTAIKHSLIKRAKIQDALVDLVEEDTLFYSDVCLLNQHKIFYKKDYIKQYDNAVKISKESLE